MAFVIGLLIVLVGDSPVCEAGTPEACSEILLAEINAERLAADLAPVAIHPVLAAIANDRAHEIAAGGSILQAVSGL